jgi:molybdenum-dependent DNA-binding transcriptional regulator ModE
MEKKAAPQTFREPLLEQERGGTEEGGVSMLLKH